MSFRNGSHSGALVLMVAAVLAGINVASAVYVSIGQGQRVTIDSPSKLSNLVAGQRVVFSGQCVAGKPVYLKLAVVDYKRSNINTESGFDEVMPSKPVTVPCTNGYWVHADTFDAAGDLLGVNWYAVQVKDESIVDTAALATSFHQALGVPMNLLDEDYEECSLVFATHVTVDHNTTPFTPNVPVKLTGTCTPNSLIAIGTNALVPSLHKVDIGIGRLRPTQAVCTADGKWSIDYWLRVPPSGAFYLVVKQTDRTFNGVDEKGRDLYLESYTSIFAGPLVPASL